MNAIFQFVTNDWRNIFRDSSLRFFLLGPVLIGVMAAWGLPALINALPTMEPYKVTLALFLGLQGSIMVGFIFSSILLEEKEEQIHLAFRILPQHQLAFLAARLLPSAIFAWLVGLVIVKCNGVLACDWQMAFKASALYIFPSPLIVLLVSTFAKNRMEGMAFFKGIDLLVTSPALYFVFEGTWREVFRIIPFWWVFGTSAAAFTGDLPYLSTMLLGFLYNLLFLLLLTQLFRRKYWQ